MVQEIIIHHLNLSEEQHFHSDGMIQIMQIYGDELELHETNSDHVQNDIMCHQIQNGNEYMIHLQHGNPQDELFSVVIIQMLSNVFLLNYSCHLLGSVAVEILVSTIRDLTGTIGHLRVAMNIMHTTSFSIRPIFILREATTVLMDIQFAVSRMNQILKS